MRCRTEGDSRRNSSCSGRKLFAPLAGQRLDRRLRGRLCEPRLLAAFAANARSQGIDLHIGRRTRRLFRDAGVADLEVDPVVSARLPGHPARRVLHTFVGNVADQLVAGGHIDRATLDADMAELARHVDDSVTLVVSHTFYRVWGRVPE